MAIAFGTQDSNNKRYDVADAVGLPDGDWAFGAWINRFQVSGTFEVFASTGNFNETNSVFTYLSSSTGVANVVTYANGSSTGGAFSAPDAFPVDAIWRLVVFQRRLGEFQLYVGELGDELLGPTNSTTSHACLDSGISAKLWKLGSNPDLNSSYGFENAMAEFFIVTEGSLALADINTLLAGNNISEVANPEVNLPFYSAAAVVEDISGNGHDATKVGPAVLTVTHPFEDTTLDTNVTGAGGLELTGEAIVTYEVEPRAYEFDGSGGLVLTGYGIVAWSPEGILNQPHLAQGGYELGGEAILDISGLLLNEEVTGAGGFTLNSTALVSFSELLDNVIVGTGGLVFSSSAAVTFQTTGGILQNQDWILDAALKDTFRYGRLHKQVNPLATRDFGPIEIGDLTEGLMHKEWTLIYSTTTGQFFLNDESQFTAADATKVDFTFDNWGYPVFVWVNTLGELWVRYLDYDSQVYVSVVLESEDCSHPFVCLAERRLPWSYRNNKIYIAYIKDGQLLTRYFLENTYGTPRFTSLVDKQGTDPIIEGMGITNSYRLQLRVRYNYGGRQK